MPKSQDELRRRAEAIFRAREAQKVDGPIAMREYLTAEQAVRDRMRILREARHAREKRQAAEI